MIESQLIGFRYQVISQYSPDAEQANFWYDQMARLVVSRNAEQKKIKLYSFTLYDELGRIKETGEKQKAIRQAQSWLWTGCTTRTNKPDHITNEVTDDIRYTANPDGQLTGNYDYDEIGNLTKDTKEKISKVEWTVYGKTKQLENTKIGTAVDAMLNSEGDKQKSKKNDFLQCELCQSYRKVGQKKIFQPIKKIQLMKG